jgi:rhamnosyltransferase
MSQVSKLCPLCIIPTRNGKDLLKRLFYSIEHSRIEVPLVIVDSESSDGTTELTQDYGINIHSIKVAEFNHGGTRQAMVELYPDYDLYIFLTQDAYLEGDGAFDAVISPFADESIGAVCGRQLPHEDATPFAEHARLFNYPEESRVKSRTDAHDLGIKTPFISNSFAAYRREALLDAGGFPKHVILSEDMYVAAKMLLKDWKVAYAADACVRHSHNYTIMEEFRRYFDTGVFHAREGWIREKFGQAGGEGKRYVLSELRFLGWRRWYLWPESILRNAVKLLGYKLGMMERYIPVRLKKGLSMHRRFWDGPYAKS